MPCETADAGWCAPSGWWTTEHPATLASRSRLFLAPHLDAYRDSRVVGICRIKRKGDKAGEDKRSRVLCWRSLSKECWCIMRWIVEWVFPLNVSSICFKGWWKRLWRPGMGRRKGPRRRTTPADAATTSDTPKRVWTGGEKEVFKRERERATENPRVKGGRLFAPLAFLPLLQLHCSLLFAGCHYDNLWQFYPQMRQTLQLAEAPTP